MNDFDKAIRNGLAADADELAGYDPMRGDGIKNVLFSAWRGDMKWATVLAWVYIWGFVAVSVWAAVRFFGSDGTREQIAFATLFLVSYVTIAIVKLWYWMLANRNSVKREVKRLELRVAELTEKLHVSD